MTDQRPDMNDYFRTQIDQWGRGDVSLLAVEVPAEVTEVHGHATDALIVVVTAGGTTWRWTGGRFAARDADGRRVPLMPVPVGGPGGRGAVRLAGDRNPRTDA